MSRCILFLFILILFLLAPLSGFSGEVQVLCEPGVSIFIDNDFKGKTNKEEEGLYIDDVFPGSHTIRAVKEGFYDIDKQITISDKILEIPITFVKQKENIRRLEEEDKTQMNQEVSFLELRAVPPRPKATVYIDGKRKDEGSIAIDGISIGKHTIKWVRNGESLTYYANLKAGKTLKLKADFRDKKVINETLKEQSKIDSTIKMERNNREVAKTQSDNSDTKNSNSDEKESVTKLKNKITTELNNKQNIKKKLLKTTKGYIAVYAGGFLMGSPSNEVGRKENESLHPVTITYDYEIKSSEVSQKEFKEVMGYNPSYFKECGVNCPVEQVSWHEAIAYCNELSEINGYEKCYSCIGKKSDIKCKLKNNSTKYQQCKGYRLPTEAEWEYAAKAGTTTAFHCGSNSSCLSSIAWYDSNSNSTTHPVKHKQSNNWGVYDMSGNVWEWCWDYYSENYSGKSTDPTGPSFGKQRVRRGGSSYYYADDCRSAVRNNFTPEYRYELLGFRPVRTLEH